MTCKNCKHWKPWASAPGMGHCKIANPIYHEKKRDDNIKGVTVEPYRLDLINAWPVSIFSEITWKDIFEKLDFLTGKDFGCIHFSDGKKK